MNQLQMVHYWWSAVQGLVCGDGGGDGGGGDEGIYNCS